jgi:hypothetical protein
MTMKPLEFSEIRNIAEYELERPSLRQHIIAMKERRRIGVGDHLTLLFENRDTVRYQIQEMMRIERLVKPADIQHEIDTFNELLPGTNELSATLLVEYPTAEERDVKLRQLLGLENHLWLRVAGTALAKARFDTRQIATDRISSVQFVRFVLTPEQASHWSQGATLIVDHPAYQAEHTLTAEQLSELAGDLN